MHGARQKIARRNKIGVEDGDQLAGRGLHAFLQCARLEPGAIVAVQILDGHSGGLIFADQRFGERMRVVGGIVQHLDLQQLARVLHLAGLFDQPLHHVALVIQRKLDGHARKRGPALHRFRRQVAAVLPVLPDHLEAVAAVE